MNNIVGHKKQIQYFKKLIENKNYLHAYLFDGTSGIGKKTIALEISKAILCKDDSDRRLFENSNFNDFLLISPIDNEIKTEEVKKIHEYLLTAPLKAEKKIIIIDDVDKMNLIAQNKILKIIEEPPAYAIFFLITSNKEAIIDTLLSRLIRISFNALSSSEINEYAVANNLDFDEDIALLSNGSVSKYLELINDDENTYFDFVTRLINALKSKDNLEIFDLVKEIEKDKENLHDLLDALEFMAEKTLDFDKNNKNISPKELQEKALIFSEYMQIIAETRMKNKSNVQKDLLISNLMYKMQGVFKW